LKEGGEFVLRSDSQFHNIASMTNVTPSFIQAWTGTNMVWAVAPSREALSYADQ